MDTLLVKESILSAFEGILNDLSLEELEDLKDLLTIKIFEMTDDGERMSLEEVKKQLEIK